MLKIAESFAAPSRYSSPSRSSSKSSSPSPGYSRDCFRWNGREGQARRRSNGGQNNIGATRPRKPRRPANVDLESQDWAPRNTRFAEPSIDVRARKNAEATTSGAEDVTPVVAPSTTSGPRAPGRVAAAQRLGENRTRRGMEARYRGKGQQRRRPDARRTGSTFAIFTRRVPGSASTDTSAKSRRAPLRPVSLDARLERLERRERGPGDRDEFSPS